MDMVGNTFSIIRNGQLQKLRMVQIPYSINLWEISLLLYIEGFLLGCKKTSTSIFLFLKYHNNLPAIRKIQRVSSPGKRMYSKALSLPKWKRGLGMFIISTSKGLLSDRDARTLQIGGEVIGQVF